jgi:uncharacterized membrane protein
MIEVFAHLHPIFVHFPIALVIAALLAEFLAYVRRDQATTDSANATTFFCLSLAAASCILAGTSGWMLASLEEFHGEAADTLLLHRWGGVSLTLVVTLSWALAYLGKLRAFRTVLVLGSGLTLGVGHTGGTLVHGDDLVQLTIAMVRGADTAPEAESPAFDESRASLGTATDGAPHVGIPPALPHTINFDKDIHPIFQNSCGKCHLAGKAKGGFRMDSRDELLRGGETGASIVPGNGASSYLVELVAGLDPDKIMPEKGRRLTTHEIALIRTWIDQGAPWGTGSGDAYVRAEKAPLRFNTSSLQNGEGKRPLSALIDQVIGEYFKLHRLTPPPPVDDRTFMRRVSLDLVGTAPSFDEVLEFERSKDPHKREALVDQLLGRRVAYTTHWISFWNDLLRNDYTGAGFVDRGRKDITTWVFRALVENYPYDRMVRELVHPNEESSGFVRGIVWRGVVNPNERPEMQAAQNIAQAFLGVNLKCASCHDSFTDHWTLDDAYGLANVYATEPLESHRCDAPIGRVAPARFIYPELGDIDPTLPREKRTARLADIITSQDNALLAKNIANRIWAQLLGSGIVMPLDEMSHQPWSQPLLELLARGLQAGDFDIKSLIKGITLSSIYQSAFVSSQTEATDTEHASSDDEQPLFRGGLERRLKSEQFEDVLRRAFEVPEPGSSKEWTRWIDLLNRHRNEAEAPFAPVAVSTPITSSAPSTKLEAVVKGARTLWLVAIPEGIPFNARRTPKTPLAWKGPSLTMASGARVSLSTLPPLAIGGRSTASPSANSDLTFLGKPVADGLKIRAPEVLAFDISQLGAESFSAEVGFQAEGSTVKGERSFRFLVFTDLYLPASLQDRTPFATALGRLARDTIISERPGTLSTLDALELTNGTELHAILSAAAASIVAKKLTPEAQVEDLWQRLLLRRPSPEERDSATEFLIAPSDADVTPTQSAAQSKIEDLLWSVALLPEFQLIR